MKISIDITGGREVAFAAAPIRAGDMPFGLAIGTRYTLEATGPIGRRTLAAAADIFDEATEEERRMILAPKAVNLRVEVHGFAIERDIVGQWTLTPPPRNWGFDTVKDMLDAGLFAPAAEELESAAFSYAPDMAEIVQALCERLEAMVTPR